MNPKMALREIPRKPAQKAFSGEARERLLGAISEAM